MVGQGVMAGTQVPMGLLATVEVERRGEGAGFTCRFQPWLVYHVMMHPCPHPPPSSPAPPLLLPWPRPSSGWLGDAPKYSFHTQAKRADIMRGLPGNKPSFAEDPGPGMYEAPSCLGIQVGMSDAWLQLFVTPLACTGDYDGVFSYYGGSIELLWYQPGDTLLCVLYGCTGSYWAL